MAAPLFSPPCGGAASTAGRLPARTWEGFGFNGGFKRFRALLGGSWVVISGVIIKVTIVITHIQGLINLLVSTQVGEGFMRSHGVQFSFAASAFELRT